MELGVEGGDADPFAGQGVGVAVGEPVDESVQVQTAEVVADLAHVVVLAEESGNEPTKAFVGGAGDGREDAAQGAGQSHDAQVAEAQGSGSVALLVVGLVDALKERSADGTALAGTLDHKESVVNAASFVDQLGQV